MRPLLRSAARHYGGNLKGKWFLTSGLGGMGGAQPLAATMAGASLIAVECQPSRIEMRLRTKYLDAQAAHIDEALKMIERRAPPRQAYVSWCSGKRRRTAAADLSTAAYVPMP